MKYRWIPVALALTLVSCISVRYRSPAFADRTGFHEKVAILPFEMVITGKLPAALTADEIAFIEEEESLAFQRSLYHALLDRSGPGRGRISIAVQPVERTNAILQSRGITPRESWKIAPQRLAEVLGVDAVVQTRVEKTRYLSERASFGIDVGRELVFEATDGRWDWLIPPGLSRTHDIFADASVFDGYDGDLLWKVVVERDADWSRAPNAVIVGVTRMLARKFPYRGAVRAG